MFLFRSFQGSGPALTIVKVSNATIDIKSINKHSETALDIVIRRYSNVSEYASVINYLKQCFLTDLALIDRSVYAFFEKGLPTAFSASPVVIPKDSVRVTLDVVAHPDNKNATINIRTILLFFIFSPPNNLFKKNNQNF